MKQSPLLHHPELIAWFLMTDISRLFRQLVDEEVRPLRMTRNQWYLVAHVYYWQGLNQQELTRLLDISKSSTARMIHLLEKKGWLQREVDKEDKRAWRVKLAPGMVTIVRDLTELARISLEHSFTDFDETKFGQIISLLREIEAGVQEPKSPGSDARIKSLRGSIAKRLNVPVQRVRQKVGRSRRG